jgi:hypothetical protein
MTGLESNLADVDDPNVAAEIHKIMDVGSVIVETGAVGPRGVSLGVCRPLLGQ